MQRFFCCLGAFLSVSMCLFSHDRLESIKIYQSFVDSSCFPYGEPNGEFNGEYHLINHVLRSGDVVFDIGADVGNWSYRALKAHSDISLYAFEPVPTSFDMLQKNLNLPNAHLYNIAISQEVGTTDFHVYSGSSGSTDCSSIYFRPVISHALAKKITVNTQNLDYFCKTENIDQIDFLKIDAEGAELFILNGAQELLVNKSIRLIQFEYGGCNIDSKTTLKQLFEVLARYGYSIYCIASDGLIKVDNWVPSLENFQYSNFLASLND